MQFREGGLSGLQIRHEGKQYVCVKSWENNISVLRTKLEMRSFCCLRVVSIFWMVCAKSVILSSINLKFLSVAERKETKLSDNDLISRLVPSCNFVKAAKC